MKIKRKLRFEEYTDLQEYTGFIFISNKLLSNDNPYKEIKLNITKFFTKNYSNNFFLEDKYINKNIENHICKKYEIEKTNILCVDKVYQKPKKNIYLVYLNFCTNFKYIHNILNMYSFDKLKKYNDLYYYIFSKTKKNTSYNKFKLLYDSNNYVSVDLKNIYYYLCGNEYANNDLKEFIDI